MMKPSMIAFISILFICFCRSSGYLPHSQISRIKINTITVASFKNMRYSQSYIYSTHTDINANENNKFSVRAYFSRVFSDLRRKISTEKVTKVLMSVMILALFFVTFNISPAIAATAKSTVKKSVTKATAATATATKKTTPKFVKFLTKVFQGINAKGISKTMKAGDSRSDISALINSVTSMIIFGGLGFIAYTVQLQREFKWNRRRSAELLRVREYKENMYFDAVEDILKKLKDPQLKGSSKSYLQKQLKDLDPDGLIVKYVTEGGERPDLSYLIDKKPQKKKPATGATTSSSTSNSNTSKPLSSKPKPSASSSSTDKPTKSSSSSSSKSPSSSSSSDNDVATPRDKASSSGGGGRGASSTGSNGNGSSTRGGYEGFLGDLFSSLEGVLDNETRKKVVEDIKLRLDKIPSPDKRKNVTVKLEAKLNDQEYWKEYAENLE